MELVASNSFDEEMIWERCIFLIVETKIDNPYLSAITDFASSKVIWI